LDGAARIDRRAVYASIKHGTRANQALSDYRRGVVRSIVTGAGTFQKHQHSAGLAASPECPFCDSGEVEDEEHAYWRCPAWADVRRAAFGRAHGSLDVSSLPAITRTCGLLTESPEELAAGREFLPLAPPRAAQRGPLGTEDDTSSYGRRVVATDGSATGARFPHRMRRAGYGVAWGEGNSQNLALPLQGPWASNQRAELMAALHATILEPHLPLLIRTDSAWTLAGALVLLAGYDPDPRWEAGDLWRDWARALRERDPGAPVSLQKVKAHVTEADFEAGVIMRDEAEANERADAQAAAGRLLHGVRGGTQ